MVHSSSYKKLTDGIQEVASGLSVIERREKNYNKDSEETSILEIWFDTVALIQLSE